MLYWWMRSWLPVAERIEDAAAADSRVFLTARIAFAAVTSFLAALVLGPAAIRWLRRQRVGERIDSASSRLNELHAGKKDTPTMGGLFLVAAIVASTALWADLENRYVQIGLFVAVSFAILGGADDWVKLRTRKRGLSARAKLIGQILLGVAAATMLYLVQRTSPRGTDLVCPTGPTIVTLGVLAIGWGAFVMVGSSNGVNLTDGLDGLAAGCLVFAGAAVAALAYLAGNRVMADYLSVPHFIGGGELAVLTSASVGACLGFLWFNGHPADVFMGDIGSLPLGALLSYVALAVKQELLLIVIGGVFVVETLSVIVQVSGYRLTGRRLLACSPLHHHFQFRGMPETKIVVRFWIVAALLAIAGLGSLKLRSL